MPAGAENPMFKHGHRGATRTSPTWVSWRALVARCYNTGASDYPRYGGRGITVCDRWRSSFSAFLEDVGERPDGMTLDRLDSDGNYEPGNVRWATAQQQNRNRRNNRMLTMGGRTQCLADWSEETGIPRDTLGRRLKKGWPVEEALTRPLMSRAERGGGLYGRGVRSTTCDADGSVSVSHNTLTDVKARQAATRQARRERALGLLPLFDLVQSSSR